jgi:hypothetical protein
MKKILFAIALLLLAGAAARAQDITAEPDPTNGVTIFSPKTVERVRSQNASLVYWRVYPVIMQSLDKNTKRAALKVEITTPVGVNRKTTLIINVDGQMFSDSPQWTTLGSLGDRAVGLVDLHDQADALSFQRVASANTISLTEMHKNEQITVRLAGKNLEVFKTMFAKYSELSPR